jgi:hypothetical protein
MLLKIFSNLSEEFKKFCKWDADLNEEITGYQKFFYLIIVLFILLALVVGFCIFEKP